MKFSLSILLSFASIVVFSQSSKETNRIQGKDLYNYLIKQNGEITIEPALREIKDILQLDSFDIKSICRFKNQLFILENGTGRILKLDSLGLTKRIDKTIFSGDRFGSYEFIYHDTLYSFGGYGFWRLNGGFRYYDEMTREWSALRTNKLVPAARGINALIHFDEQAEKLYVINQAYEDEYLSIKQKTLELLYVNIFNLKNKQWEETFLLNPKIAKWITDIKVISTSPESIFIHTKSTSDCIELNFRNNKYYRINESFVTLISQINSQNPGSIIFKKDKDLIYKNLASGTTATINLSKIRVENLGRLYESYELPNNNKERFILIISLILNTLLIITILINRRKIKEIKPKIDPIEEDSDENKSKEILQGIELTKSFAELLDETEKAILTKISTNRAEGNTTSIDEINKIIGIEKRPYKIQNNIRADALKLINKKFNDFTNTNDSLIIRKRSVFDKRFFNYDINDRYASKVLIK